MAFSPTVATFLSCGVEAPSLALAAKAPAVVEGDEAVKDTAEADGSIDIIFLPHVKMD
jgi:hypothetical protein